MHRNRAGVYERHQTTIANVGFTLKRLQQSHLGLNVTAPLKTEVLDYCHGVSALAAQLGAANTLVAKKEGWWAENTDATGLLNVLGGAQSLRGQTVAVLGAGGAARAVVWALEGAGCEEIRVHCRSQRSFSILNDRSLTRKASLQWRPWGDVKDPVDLVINSTPLGRHEPLPIELRSPRIIDLNYRPHMTTELCRQSRSIGLIAQDGRALLLEQALLAQQLWFGDLPVGLRDAMTQPLMK